MTIEQRKQIYERALAYYKGGGSSEGLCARLFRAYVYIFDLFDGYNYSNLSFDFPDIWKHKPSSNYKDSGYWFPLDEEGKLKRMAILEQAIKEIDEKQI